MKNKAHSEEIRHRLLVEVYVDILKPLWRDHPDLTPPEMEQPSP